MLLHHTKVFAIVALAASGCWHGSLAMFMQLDADANHRISMSEFAMAQRASAKPAMPQ